MYERSYHGSVLKKEGSAPRTFPWKRLGIVVATILLCTGIVFLIRVPKFQVKEVVVEGAFVVDPVEVTDFVLGGLEGNYLFVLPKTSIFLSKPDSIALQVQERFPRFKFVEVKRDSMDSLKVIATEYPGVYLWCDGDDTCSFMDETGTVFADAPYFSGTAYLKVYGGERAVYPFKPLTPAQLALMVLITVKLGAIDIAVTEFSVEDAHTLTARFSHHGNPAAILFEPNRDINEALDVLYSGLRTDPLQKMYHDRTRVLEYLDLRFSNKVVYKFNNEFLETTER